MRRPTLLRDIGTLGANYRRLWLAHAVSNLGDGVRLTALPLLGAQITRDPALIAGLTIVSFLPWLLFGLLAGVVVDRVDRRRAVALANLVRTALMAALGAVVLLGEPGIALLYAVAFLLASAETVADNAAQVITPAVVPRERLERANGLLYAAETATNQFAGPALGGALFAADAAAPFFLDAASFLVSAGLVSRLRGTFRPRRAGVGAQTVLGDLREGLAWLFRQPFLRTLALMLGTINLFEMAWFSVFVLFALEILHLSSAGYGILLAVGAAGSLAGSLLAPGISRRLGAGRTLVVVVFGLALATLALGLSSHVLIAAAAWTSVGFLETVWLILTLSLRQAIVPDELLGRVNSAYRVLGWGTIPPGALLGGALTRSFGLRSPFILCGVVFLLMGLATQRTLVKGATGRR